LSPPLGVTSERFIYQLGTKNHMDEKLFERLGLTKGEIKVYLALIALGQSTSGPIVTESKVTKSKVYDILEKLIEKGLAGHIIKSGTKHFMPNDPHMILEYLSRKEDELKTTKQEVIDILPQLTQKIGTADQKRIAEMYEGYTGIMAIRDELMNTFRKGESLLVLGAPKEVNELMEGKLLAFHRRRIKNKIGMRIIYNSDAREFGNVRKKMQLTQVRYFPNNLVSPNWIDIFPETVMFAILLKKPICFVVRDKSLANSFRTYFEMIWKTTEE
jgi:sugar-specific transcriptional regulator TrmB